MASRETIPELSESAKFSVFVAPAARFASEYVTALEGLSVTKMMERAMLMYATAAGAKNDHKGWQHYWDAADGSPEVALLLLYTDKTLAHDAVRQSISDVIYAHERFFFEREGRTLKAKRRFVEALWPHVASGKLPQHWAKSKAVDAWATGEMMQEMLKRAKLKPPAWGPTQE